MSILCSIAHINSSIFFVAKLNAFSIPFFITFFAVPFKYEALSQDHLHLGSEDTNQYAPVYPVYCARPSKRRQLSEQSLASASEQSSSQQSLNEQLLSNEPTANEWNDWSSEEFGDLVIGDAY